MTKFVSIASLGVAIPVASIAGLTAKVYTLNIRSLIEPENENDHFKMEDTKILRIEVYASIASEKKNKEFLVDTLNFEIESSGYINLEENLSSILKTIEDKKLRVRLRKGIKFWHKYAQIKANSLIIRTIKVEDGTGGFIERSEPVGGWTEENENDQSNRVEKIASVVEGETEAEEVNREEWTSTIIDNVKDALNKTITNIGLV